MNSKGRNTEIEWTWVHGKYIAKLVDWGVMLSLFAFVILPGTVSAQVEPPWNREVRGVSVLPDSAGGEGVFRVNAAWNVSANESTVPLDLSAEAVLVINGIPVGDPIGNQILFNGVTFSCLDGGENCGGSCGFAEIDGGGVGLTCYEDCPNHSNPDLPLDCECGLWISAEFPSINVSLGDEIMVILRPAPGALPDDDTSDDFIRHDFRGGAIFWNRRVEAIAIAETPGAPPDTYDISVSGSIAFDGQPTLLNLDTELVLLHNGTVLATEFLPQRAEGDSGPTCFAQGCGAYCGKVNNIEVYCDPALFHGCACGGGWLTNFPGVPIPNLQPEDEIMVLLRPAPGALPEFWDIDDQIVWDPPAASIGEGSAARALRLEQNQPNPFKPQTTIHFSLEAAGPVTIDVFSADGRLVRNLLDEDLGAGRWSVTWNGATDRGEAAAAGTYFYRMTSRGETVSRKMHVLD